MMQDISSIERQLASGDVEVRRDAVLSLRNFQGDEAGPVRVLFQAMTDPSWRVRKTAVETLVANYPQESYMNGLLSLLQREDNAGARNSAIEVFIRLGKKATDFLISSFNTTNADMRKFIIDILGQVADKKAVPLMIEALKDEDENVSSAAVEHLGNMKEPSVVGVLIDKLREGNMWTAYPAADALGRIGDRRAVPALIEALGEKTLREPALRALGSIADASAARHAAEFIDDNTRSVQFEALMALEKIYGGGAAEDVIINAIKEHFGEKSFELLMELSKNDKPEVKASAILLLGLLKDERALHPLLEISTEEEYAGHAKRALVYMGRQDAEMLLPLFATENAYLRRLICDVASEVASPMYFDTLLGFLENEDGHVRSSAALGIAEIGDHRAVGKLKRMLQDPYVDVQEAALKALASLKGGLNVSGLLSDLNSKDRVLRKNVALLLGEVAPEGADSALGFKLKDEDVSVRKAVVTSLSKIGTQEAYRYIAQALTDEDPGIRVSAVLSLGMARGKGYADKIILLTEDSEDMVKVAAAKALGMLDIRDTVQFLIRMLAEDNGFVVIAAIDAIGRMRGEEARDALREMLNSKDREIRRAALRALSSFSGAEDEILPFIRDDDWATRVAAVESLGAAKSARVRHELEKLYDTEEDHVVRRALENILYVA